MKTITRAALLTFGLAALAACGQSTWQPRPGAQTSAVTLSVAFASPASKAVRPQGVPSSANSVAVKIMHNGQEIKFDADGNPMKEGGSAIVLTPGESSKPVNLPTGVDYDLEFSALHSTIEIAYDEMDLQLTGDTTVRPQFQTIIGSVSLEPGVSTFKANTSYPVRLRVLAPDGSDVPASDYSATAYSLDSATDAKLGAESPRGALVKFGLVLSSTLSVSVEGMNLQHGAASFGANKTFNLEKASGNISADLQAPTVTVDPVKPVYTIVNGVRPMGVLMAPITGTVTDNVDATKVVVYRDGVELVAQGVPGTAVEGQQQWEAQLEQGMGLDVGDELTVLAYDAAGNESSAVTTTVSNGCLGRNSTTINPFC